MSEENTEQKVMIDGFAKTMTEFLVQTTLIRTTDENNGRPRVRLFKMEENGLAEVSEYPLKNFKRTANTQDSFVEMAMKVGSTKDSAVYISDKVVRCVLDDHYGDGDIHYDLKNSTEMRRWFGNFNHLMLIRHLNVYGADVVSVGKLEVGKYTPNGEDVRSVLLSLSKLSFKGSTEFKSEQGDHGNVKVHFNSDKGPEIANLPEYLEISIPYYDGAEVLKFVVHLDINIPKDEHNKINFILTEVSPEKNKEEAQLQLAKQIRSAFGTDWNIYEGEVK